MPVLEIKFGSKLPNYLLVAVSQTKLAICRGVDMKVKLTDSICEGESDYVG